MDSMSARLCVALAMAFLWCEPIRAETPLFDDGFEDLADGDCTMRPVELKMYWSECGVELDCFEAVDPGDGKTYRWLRLPSSGPVTKEGHLVTPDEDFGGGWPDSFFDQITRHYANSQSTSGYVMTRTEGWQPAGEGGSQYGQPATGQTVPALDEAWYVSMYWRDRPPKGTRMLVRNPDNGRAVVAAAGYETGPGSATSIGGVPEEIHHYLGTNHRDTLELGFTLVTDLPLGPIECP